MLVNESPKNKKDLQVNSPFKYSEQTALVFN
jgi:hypothetical protein